MDKEGDTNTAKPHTFGKLDQYLVDSECLIPIEAKQAVIRISELPEDWHQLVRLIQTQIQDSTKLDTVDQCFRAWNSAAIGYYNQ